MENDNEFEDRQWSPSIAERKWDDDIMANHFRLEIRDQLVVGSIRLGELWIGMDSNVPRGMSLKQEPGILI